MLKMSVIILIGILIVNGDENIKSIETISDISNEVKLENSKIVTIKMKPNQPVDIRRSDMHHSAEKRTADDDQLIFVKVRTGDLPDSTITSNPSDSATEINVSTRRFITDNGSGTDESKEESRIADQETSRMDEVERTADSYQHNDNHPTEFHNKEIDYSDQMPTTDVIGRGAISNLYEPSSTAESRTGETEVKKKSPNTSLLSDRTGESVETPTRRSHHDHDYSSVLDNGETKTESVTPDKSEHEIEIARQGSETIEEDIEVVKTTPIENARRKFNGFENYPDISIFDDDDLIKTAKSRENLHDILIDTKSRSGMPQHDLNIPRHTLYFSEPNTNDYQYAKTVDYPSHNIKKINGHQPQHKPIIDYEHYPMPISSGYQPYIKKHIADYQPHNIKPTAYQSHTIPLAYDLHEPHAIGGYLPYDNSLIPNYNSYTIRSSFDYYQSDDVNRYIDFLPHIPIPPRPHIIKSINDHELHNNNKYRHQDVNTFNGNQLKRPPANYPPFDYINSFTDYPPFIKKPRKCFHIRHGINQMSIINQLHTKRPSVNQPYNMKPSLGYQFYHNIKPIASQSPNLYITNYQSIIPTANALNTSTANYRSLKIPITGFQPYNTKTVNQQLNVKPLFNDQLYNNRLHDSGLAAYYTQDTSRLVSASSSPHPRKEPNYHPVYGNHHHYETQHLQPNYQMNTMNPTPIDIHRTVHGNLGSTSINIMNPLSYANGIHVPGLRNTLNFNSNLGFFRNIFPYRQNSRIVLSTHHNPRHLISVRSIDRDSTAEEKYADYEDEIDGYGHSNNYPYINRYKDEGLNNMYNYETTTRTNYPFEPLYRSAAPTENYPDKPESSESSEIVHNNPLDAVGPNNRPYEHQDPNNNLRGSHNNPYDPRSLANYPYVTRDLGNNPYDLSGLGNNPYESNIRSFEPYMSLPNMFRRFHIE